MEPKILQATTEDTGTRLELSGRAARRCQPQRRRPPFGNRLRAVR